MICMQTLGLASEQKPTDGLLKRLFWPTIENEYDVDLVRRQGFWLCVVVATISLVMVLATGPLWLGAVIGLTYLLAGAGVREGSVGAAALIFLCYLSDRVVAVESAFIGFGGGSPLVGLFALALLLSNVRATLLTRRWTRDAGEDSPAAEEERSTETLSDKVVNRFPAAVWPKGQYIFFPLASGVLLFSVYLIVTLPGIHRRHLEQQQRFQEDNRQSWTVPVR